MGLKRFNHSKKASIVKTADKISHLKTIFHPKEAIEKLCRYKNI